MAINDQEKQATHSCTSTPRRSDSINHGVDEDAISPQPPLNPGDAHDKPWPRRRTESTIDAEGEDDTALGRLASVTGRTRTRSASNVPPPPDGGMTAWIQVVGGWLVLFTCWGYINSFGSFQSYYTTTALPDHSASAISWIGSVQGFLTTAIGAFAGRMLDAGLFRPTFAVGALLQLGGIFAMSASDSPKYWQLMLTQGILTGLGSGILFTPTIALVATWFGNRRGMAIGLATTGNSVGGIVYPLIVRELIPKVGFAWTVRALGLVNLVCLGTTFLIMRSRLPPRRSGPLVEAKAFTESVYSAYVVGLFFFVWASNYTFYYVSLLASTNLVPWSLVSSVQASLKLRSWLIVFPRSAHTASKRSACLTPTRPI
jgi:MFS family permease